MSKIVDLTQLVQGLDGKPLSFGERRKTISKDNIPTDIVESIFLSYKEIAIRKMSGIRVSKKDDLLGTQIFNLLVKLNNHTAAEEFTDVEIDLLMDNAFYGTDVITVNKAKELLLQ